MNAHKKCIFKCLAVIALVASSTLSFANNYPQWWLDRGVISSNTNATPNDFALANQGQLKWMATQCAKEFEFRLPGGAGASVWGIINDFSRMDNNAALNVGQLKKAVQPFYDRLYPDHTNAYPVGRAGKYPWSYPDGLCNDYASVNIGQLKCVFSFDLDRSGLGASAMVSVSGNISYSGSQQGKVTVLAALTEAGWARAYSITLNQPGSYTITNISAGRSVWVRVFIDTDNNGVGNGSEPWGNCALNPFSPTSNVSSVNITLKDAGAGCDGVPDWWKLNHFGSLAQNGSMDFDNDGLNNYQEFLVGTDPAKSDTDGDGLNDNVDPHPLSVDADANGLSDKAEAAFSASTNRYGTTGVLIHVFDKGWYRATETNLTLISLGE